MVFRKSLSILFFLSIIFLCEGDHSYTQRNLKILNGEPAEENRFPYSCSICKGYKKDENIECICSGVLIEPLWVLTVASCGLTQLDQDQKLYVIIGEITKGISKEKIEEAEIIKVAKYHQHSSYQGNPYGGFDAALLYLEEKSSKKTIDIAEIDEKVDNTFIGLGWNTVEEKKESKLNWISLEYVNNVTCKEEWDLISTPIFIHDSMICAIGKDKSSTCEGDEGSALILDKSEGGASDSGDPSQDYLIGLNSINLPECDNNYNPPNIYTHTSAIRDWINQEIKSVISIDKDDEEEEEEDKDNEEDEDDEDKDDENEDEDDKDEDEDDKDKDEDDKDEDDKDKDEDDKDKDKDEDKDKDKDEDEDKDKDKDEDEDEISSIESETASPSQSSTDISPDSLISDISSTESDESLLSQSNSNDYYDNDTAMESALAQESMILNDTNGLYDDTEISSDVSPESTTSDEILDYNYIEPLELYERIDSFPSTLFDDNFSVIEIDELEEHSYDDKNDNSGTNDSNVDLSDEEYNISIPPPLPPDDDTSLYNETTDDTITSKNNSMANIPSTHNPDISNEKDVDGNENDSKESTNWVLTWIISAISFFICILIIIIVIHISKIKRKRSIDKILKKHNIYKSGPSELPSNNQFDDAMPQLNHLNQNPNDDVIGPSPFLMTTLGPPLSVTTSSEMTTDEQKTRLLDVHESMVNGVGEMKINLNITLVGRKLGSGGHGMVQEGIYKDDSGNDVPVAVKIVGAEEDKARSALINELTVLDKVGNKHPNIVKCFGGKHFDPEGAFYIVEELMETDLGKFIHKKETRQHLKYKDILDIFSGIVNGLHYLHECSIIHFDLKPNNVLLDINNIPKLADFGCSREKACTYITANMVGTVAYMAPELWLLGMYTRGSHVRAEKIDIFSFGVVMWECITGEKPKDPFCFRDYNNTLNNDESEATVTEESTELSINEGFREKRFPLKIELYPNSLIDLIWNCVSYYNYLRPTTEEIQKKLNSFYSESWINDSMMTHEQ